VSLEPVNHPGNSYYCRLFPEVILRKDYLSFLWALLVFKKIYEMFYRFEEKLTIDDINRIRLAESCLILILKKFSSQRSEH